MTARGVAPPYGLSNRAAADALGISETNLRRYAKDYEALHGPLPRYAGGRVYGDAVLSRLKTAQAMQRSREAPSIRVALERLEAGSRADLLPDAPFEEGVRAWLDSLLGAVERLNAESLALHERVGALEGERGTLLPEAPGELWGDRDVTAPPATTPPAEAEPADGPPAHTPHEQDDTPGEETGGADVKKVTFYLSEESWRFLGMERLGGRGSMSEQVEALVRERMRAREVAEGR